MLQKRKLIFIRLRPIEISFRSDTRDFKDTGDCRKANDCKKSKNRAGCVCVWGGGGGGGYLPRGVQPAPLPPNSPLIWLRVPLLSKIKL